MNLTKAQQQRVRSLIRSTWNVIAADMPEDVSNADMIEVVLDADYTASYGRDKEANGWLQDLTFDEQDEIANEAFFGRN